jgi:hypothetical protein
VTGADALTLTAAVIGVLAALVKIYLVDVEP